jgi:hypothetical protein
LNCQTITSQAAIAFAGRNGPTFEDRIEAKFGRVFAASKLVDVQHPAVFVLLKNPAFNIVEAVDALSNAEAPGNPDWRPHALFMVLVNCLTTYGNFDKGRIPVLTRDERIELGRFAFIACISGV